MSDVRLMRYDAARQALQEAHAVDEIKAIRDKAQALAAYAKQAKDHAMIAWATEIKIRAERKAGEMLRQSAELGTRATKNQGGTGSNQHKQVSRDTTPAPTLSDLNISRDQSSRWQKLAEMPEAHFEAAVETAKEVAGEVTTAALLRAANPPPAPRKIYSADDAPPPAPIEPTPPPNVDAIYSAIETLARATIPPRQYQAHLPWFMHGSVESNLDAAIAYLTGIQAAWSKSHVA